MLSALTKGIPNIRKYKVVNHFLHRCEGFSGADLAHLVKEAAIYALSTAPIDEQHVVVGMEHFQTAFTKVYPSVSKKVCFSTFVHS
jgi:SpoVK/Ycf46/Vps4 family AAA+-type ATPase